MPDLIELPFEQARDRKWKAGRALYGEEFVGEWLREAYGEAVDGANYAEHGLHTEPKTLHPRIEKLRELFERAGALCQEIYAERERSYGAPLD